MFLNLANLINEIKEATYQVDIGALKCLRTAELGTLQALLSFNRRAGELFQVANKESATWINKAIEFLYQEFVNEDVYSPGRQKYRKLRQYSTQISDVLSDEAKKSFKPFFDLFEKYQCWPLENKHVRESCLIVTALPLEFRAVVRRLSGIVSVDAIPHDSPDVIKLSADISAHDALRWAFDIERDEFEVVEGDRKKKERPFWLILEGVMANNASRAKVTIILLPEYGGHLAQKGIGIAWERGVVFREVLVVGVAGRLAEEEEVGIGDVVVSINIFDSTLRKEVTRSRGKIQFLKKDQPFEFDPPAYNPDGWIPRLHETKPVKGKYKKYKGFQHLIPADIVSGSSLSKAADYKKILQTNFPTCKAVEMEALGCCIALSNKKLPVRVIKGLCDNADFRKSKEWQPYCADVAAAFAGDYILGLFGDPLPGSPLVSRGQLIPNGIF